MAWVDFFRMFRLAFVLFTVAITCGNAATLPPIPAFRRSRVVRPIRSGSVWRTLNKAWSFPPPDTPSDEERLTWTGLRPSRRWRRSFTPSSKWRANEGERRRQAEALAQSANHALDLIRKARHARRAASDAVSDPDRLRDHKRLPSGLRRLSVRHQVVERHTSGRSELAPICFIPALWCEIPSGPCRTRLGWLARSREPVPTMPLAIADVDALKGYNLRRRPAPASVPNLRHDGASRGQLAVAELGPHPSIDSCASEAGLAVCAQFSRLGSDLPRLLPTQRILPDRNGIAPPRANLQPEYGSGDCLAAALGNGLALVQRAAPRVAVYDLETGPPRRSGSFRSQGTARRPLVPTRSCWASDASCTRPASACRASSRHPGSGWWSSRVSFVCGRPTNARVPSHARHTSTAHAANGSRHGSGPAGPSPRW